MQTLWCIPWHRGLGGGGGGGGGGVGGAGGWRGGGATFEECKREDIQQNDMT